MYLTNMKRTNLPLLLKSNLLIIIFVYIFEVCTFSNIFSSADYEYYCPLTGIEAAQKKTDLAKPKHKVGIPNFVSGPEEYIMEGEYLILAMCSWFRISCFRIIC